jgi:hypothetical protein
MSRTFRPSGPRRPARDSPKGDANNHVSRRAEEWIRSRGTRRLDRRGGRLSAGVRAHSAPSSRRTFQQENVPGSGPDRQPLRRKRAFEEHQMTRHRWLAPSPYNPFLVLVDAVQEAFGTCPARGEEALDCRVPTTAGIFSAMDATAGCSWRGSWREGVGSHPPTSRVRGRSTTNLSSSTQRSSEVSRSSEAA